MANSKFPGLDQKYIQEIEQRTANVPAGAKEMLQQKMYSDFYAQQKREEEQQERLAMKNEIAKKQLEANSGTDTGANLQLKKGNLADAIRNFYKLTISQGDDDSLVSKFTKGIKNGDKMYIDYLNGDNNDIMIQTGLLGDTAKNLYNSPYNTLNKGNNLANGNNQNIPESAKTLIENKPGNSNAVMYSSSVFDDDQYSKYYLDNVEDDYKPFVEAAKSQGYSDGEIASIIDKRKTYEDFTNRGFGDKAEEVNVGVFQGFANFLGNAYNNLLGENPYVGIAPKLNMNDIQFADDLLGSTNNYGDLRAESGWTKTGEFGGDLIANTALMALLPGMGGTAKMESIAESALNGTRSVLKNIGQRFLYGAAEGAEFGALNTLGQENADLDKLESNMGLGAAFGGTFGLGGAGVNSYKYRNILNTLRKEGDKEGTIKGLLDMYNRGVKPTSQGVKTNTQLQNYNEDAMGAVESIIKNKDALKYVDANGEETFGHLPRSLDEFSQAIKQTKQSIYDRYATIAKDAGQTTNVDTSDIVTALKKQLKDKEWRAGQSEATIGKMEKWIKDLEDLNNTMSVEGAQAKVQELNQKIQAFLKSQNPNDVSPNAVDGLVLNGLKKGIDDAIDKAGLDSEEYIQLRNMYRQLKSIESDVNHRAVVYGRQNPQSLVDSMSDLQTIDAIADIFSNPIGGTVKLVKTKAFKALAKDRNDSNKIVEKMFKEADDTINKTDTLKTQTQIAAERTQKQQMNIRKNRQQRLEEAQARQAEIQRVKEEIQNKIKEQQEAYQTYLKNKGVGSETKALPQREGVTNYNTIIADSGKPTVITPEGTAVRQGQIAERPTENVNYIKQQLKDAGVSDEQIEKVVKEIEQKNQPVKNYKESVSEDKITLTPKQIEKIQKGEVSTEEASELVALHNLNIDKLRKTADLGGMPMPSIAVTRRGIPHEDYGDITLVMKKNTVDPAANPDNKIHILDGYTPEVPQPIIMAKETEAAERASQKVMKETGLSRSELEQWLEHREQWEYYHPELKNYSKEYDEIAEKKLWGGLDDEGRHYLDYNLENIVKAMKENKEDAYNGQFGKMVAQYQGGTTDLASLRSRNYGPKEGEQWDKLFDKYYDEVGNLYNKVKNDSSPINEYRFQEALAYEFDKDTSKWLQNIKEEYGDYEGSIYNKIKKSDLNKLQKIIKEGADIPRPYSEAKPERPVTFDEVSYVLAPEEQAAEVEKIIGDQVKVVPYKATEGRAAKLEELQKKYGNVFFGLGGSIFPISYLLGSNGEDNAENVINA